MKQIEDKFGLVIVFVTNDAKFWMFVGSMPSRQFHVLPVSVPANALDHDVTVAIQASNDCAVFYEEMSKKQPAPAFDSVSYARSDAP